MLIQKQSKTSEYLTSKCCVVLFARSISHLETGIQDHPNPSKNALCKPAAFACILRQVCHNVINAWAAMEMLNGDQWGAKPKGTIMGDQIKPEKDGFRVRLKLAIVLTLFFQVWFFTGKTHLQKPTFHQVIFHRSVSNQDAATSGQWSHHVTSATSACLSNRRDSSRSFPNWEPIYFLS